MVGLISAGKGIAIRPSDGMVVSPVDAEVISVATTKHAVGLRTAGGVELLIHVGIDTVKLGGAPFEQLVEAGAQVTVGQPLLRADLEAIRSAGVDTTTPIVVLEPTDATLNDVAVGDVSRGDALFRFDGGAR